MLGQIRSSVESQLFVQMVPQRSQDPKIALCLLLGLKQKVVDDDVVIVVLLLLDVVVVIFVDVVVV